MQIVIGFNINRVKFLFAIVNIIIDVAVVVTFKEY